MEEKQNQEEISTEEVKESYTSFIHLLWVFIKRTLSLREGVDRQGTVEGILHDVEFKGASAWILVCSILIACVGLGENNIPIIVGAMLISPLMGPILGIGLAAGTNNFELLKKSLTSFVVAIVLSLIISTIYFFLAPVPVITSELLSRKDATVMAIIVAFLGGAAGIIAGSRSMKSNVVPGVAIATALMPPLCAAGFGLGTFRFEFFFGAMYLFFINSVFIAVPTYLYIKYINFPIKEFLDPALEKKIKRYITIFILVIILPSGFIFYNVLTEGVFNRDAAKYLSSLEESLDGSGTFIVDKQLIYTDTIQEIKVALMGETISEKSIVTWENRLSEFNLEKSRLRIVQNEDYHAAMEDMEKRSYEQSQKVVEGLILNKEQKIEELERALEEYKSREVDMSSIANEVHMLFPELEKAAWAEQVETDFSGKLDTIPTVIVQWNEEADLEEIERSKAQLERWLTARLKKENIRVVELNPSVVSE